MCSVIVLGLEVQYQDGGGAELPLKHWGTVWPRPLSQLLVVMPASLQSTQLSYLFQFPLFKRTAVILD